MTTFDEVRQYGSHVNIAIPNMVDKLHASLYEVLWVVNGYILILAVLLITSGRLGDLRGPRTMFIAGIAVFRC